MKATFTLLLQISEPLFSPAVDINELEWTSGWSPCQTNLCKAQANALPVECDPARILKAIEVRATVSEGVIGINAISLLPAK
jgi:hypothetical protein